jgi:hypothetical protein
MNTGTAVTGGGPVVVDVDVGSSVVPVGASVVPPVVVIVVVSIDIVVVTIGGDVVVTSADVSLDVVAAVSLSPASTPAVSLPAP